jgi:hypothetical protein
MLYKDYDKTDIGTTLTVIDNSTKKPLEADSLTVSFDSSASSKMTAFSPNSGTLTKQSDTSFLLKKPSENATAYLLVKASNWNKSISLTHKVTVIDKAVKGKFDVSKVTLNKTYAEAKLLKFTCGSSYENLTFTVKSVKMGSTEYVDENGNNTSNIKLTNEDNGLLVELGSPKPEVGKYSVIVTPYVNDTELSDIKFTVQVVETANGTATISAKGKLDIVDRDNTSIIATVKLKNINGVVTDAKFTSQNGSAASKLNLDVEDGKVIITLNPQAKITSDELKKGITGSLNLTVKSDKDVEIATVESNSLKIKLTQSTVKASVAPKSIVMYKSGKGSVRNIDFATTKPVGAEIEAVTIDNTNKANKAVKDCFTISKNNDNESDGYRLSLTDKGKELKAKTYNVTVDVKIKGSVEGKTQTLKLKVVIKK